MYKSQKKMTTNKNKSASVTTDTDKKEKQDIDELIIKARKGNLESVKTIKAVLKNESL